MFIRSGSQPPNSNSLNRGDLLVQYIFKKNTLFALKNADKIIAIIIFICTTTGAWFLFSYANGHGVKFTELIQPNLLISYGAFSFFILSLIIAFFLLAFFISPIIARSLYFHILIKEKHAKIKHIKINYFLFFFLCSIAASLCAFKLIFFPFVVFIFALIEHVIVFGVNISWKKTQKTLTLFILSSLLLVISYTLLIFLSIALNFKIESTLSFNGILQALFIFIITFLLSGVGLADVHQRMKHNKNRILFYMFFSFTCVFYIATAFSNGTSEGITRQIGLGFQYRCYNHSDMVKYSIPENLTNKKTSKGKIKVFVISDSNGRVYLSRGEAYRAEYSFPATDLREIACDK